MSSLPGNLRSRNPQNPSDTLTHNTPSIPPGTSSGVAHAIRNATQRSNAPRAGTMGSTGNSTSTTIVNNSSGSSGSATSTETYLVVNSASDSTPGTLTDKLIGSSNIALTTLNAGANEQTQLSVPSSGVTAGSYTNTNLTVGADGRVTTAANGSSTSGVSSLNTLTGALTIAPGANVTVTPSGGNTLTIASTGSGITALTGDVTASGTGSVAATLATVNSYPGSVGSASNTLTATVNAKGLITALAQTAISITSSAISNFATAVNSLISAASIALSQLAQGGATTGQILEWNGSAWTPTAIGSLPISGTAGGDLSGSYPNPTVQKLNGVNLDTVGLTIGQTLIYLGGGTGWASKDPATFSVSNVFTSSTTIVSGINIYTGTAAATATVNYATSNVRILIKNYSAFALTITPYSGQLIDGASTYVLSSQYQWVDMLFNSALNAWVVIGAGTV